MLIRLLLVWWFVVSVRCIVGVVMIWLFCMIGCGVMWFRFISVIWGG